VKQAAANARWKSHNEAKGLSDGHRPLDSAALVVPGLWKWLWKKTIHDLEHDPRPSTPSMTNATAQELEAARQRWVAAECERRELEIGSPRERFTAGKAIVFQRWMVGPG
jgi:hypothetical protein